MASSGASVTLTAPTTPVKPGKIVLILSCMFAGKTETLITHARRHILARRKIVLIKYSRDTRYTIDEICSHNHNTIKATFACSELKTVAESPEVRSADVVLIDEIQFFPDAPEVCEELANNGKIVVVAGLNGNYKREEFPVISKLIPLAEEFISLPAVCSVCGENAYFTKRIVAGDGIELIGGAESYQPRCRKCF
jgi:thymidine kinase